MAGVLGGPGAGGGAGGGGGPVATVAAMRGGGGGRLDGGRGRGFEGRGARGRGRVGVVPGGRGERPMDAGLARPGAEAVPLSLPAMLANATPEQQKQILGERLFPQVQALQPELAGKITGMLLEMDNSEVLLLLDNQEALVAKVDEAIEVLKQHNAIPDAE